ncbi:MAG: hypothetical protein K2M12_00405, partial [Muribaculaceae bacterium]|nr:hypothetical protein [Muribaculaceae bacterium]
MNMRAAIILLMAVLPLWAGAQNYITPMTCDFTPPTPQSAQLMEYQMPQPSMLTGAVDLSVPIHTVQCGGYSLPIYMQYHSNGIRVMDDPTPCGYGWAIMPALRATRTILGRPDEYYDFAMSFEPDHQATAYKCMVQPYVQSVKYPGYLDSQHDIISLALPDHTVTRVMDFSSGTPVFVGGCDSEYKVSADANLDSIVVTDPRGIKYLFDGPCETQPCSEHRPYRTCWALGKIILPDGQSITISWTKAWNVFSGNDYVGGCSFLDKFSPSEWSNIGDVFENFTSNNYDNTIFQHIAAPFDILRISKIEYPGGSVKFEYTTNSNKEMRMNRIVVSDVHGTFKTATLQYDSSGFRLSKLKLSDEGDYNFTYKAGSDARPNIHRQDWWGFLNNNTRESLTPKFRIKRHLLSDDRYTDYIIVGEADRSVDTVAMLNNILTSVTYPAGGICEFEYEPHKFAPVRDETANDEIHPADNPYFTYGGGVRVKRITAKGGSGTPDRVVTYEYSPAHVRAVPSAGTFVDVNDAVIGLLDVDGSSRSVDFIRSVNIRPFSNYMHFDIGETPIWYDSVRARYAEGCVVYKHKDFIPYDNFINRKFGCISPGRLHKVYSLGPQLTLKETYATKGGKYVLVERDSMNYDVAEGTTAISMHIYRKLIHVNSTSSAAPDFDDVYEVRDSNAPDYPLKISPYEIVTYGVASLTERLKERIHTVYTDNGSITTSETYKYKKGTSLLESVSTTTSEGTAKTTAVHYANAAQGGVQAQMVAANVVGLPVREVTTCGTASVAYSADYLRAASGSFVPRRVTTTLGTGGTMHSPVLTYNSGGRPVQSTDADGRSTAWLWGYGNLHPVYKVEGIDYATLCTLDSRAASKSDRAETFALNAAGHAVWRYTYRPLAYLTDTKAPWGTTMHYTYGWRNQLASVERNGLVIASHSFSVNSNGRGNHLVDAVEYDEERFYEHTTEFDGFGRPTRSYDNLSDLVATTQYDAMGRPYRTSVLLASGTAAATTDWSVSGFEASPRGIVEWAMRPGAEWVGAGRKSTVRHLTNTGTGDYQCIRVKATATGLTVSGIYAPGRLMVTESTDEDGHIVREFTTLDGRVVQTSEGRTGDMLHTRYAYDDYNRLCAVLPPDLGAANGPYTTPSIQNKAYIYTYDELGRCTSAKMPGCDPSLTRYSRAGRVLAEHTPGMASGQWLLHHYDACGREVLTSIATATEAQLRAVADSLPVAVYDARAIGCYRLAPALPMGAGTPQTAVFYDNYDFLKSTTGLPAISRAVAPMGLPAGSRDYVAQSGGLTAAMAYDDRGFVAEEAAQTIFGTVHKSYTRDDQGSVLTETEDFTPSTGKAIRRVTTNTYDNGGRIIRRRITENGTTAEISYAYDARGNLASEKYGNGVCRRHEYDIHGWPVRTETDVPRKQTILPKPLGMQLAPEYYYALKPDPGGLPLDPGPGISVDT